MLIVAPKCYTDETVELRCNSHCGLKFFRPLAANDLPILALTIKLVCRDRFLFNCCFLSFEPPVDDRLPNIGGEDRFRIQEINRRAQRRGSQMSVPHGCVDARMPHEHLTAVSGTPRITRCEANVCLSVCQPILRKPAFFRARAIRHAIRCALKGWSSVSLGCSLVRLTLPRSRTVNAESRCFDSPSRSTTIEVLSTLLAAFLFAAR